MGNLILAGTLNFIPIVAPLALAQEKPSSPPAQLSPAPAAFGVVGSCRTVGGRKPIAAFLALATITKAEQKKTMGISNAISLFVRRYKEKRVLRLIFQSSPTLHFRSSEETLFSTIFPAVSMGVDRFSR